MRSLIYLMNTENLLYVLITLMSFFLTSFSFFYTFYTYLQFVLKVSFGT